MLRSIALVLSCSLIAGCSGATDGDPGEDPTHGDPSGSSGPGGASSGSPTGSGGDFSPSGAGGGPPTSDCAEASKLVYLVDEDHTLYRFDPQLDTAAAFTKIGTVDCPNGEPNSMAVGRDGYAYVLFGTDDDDFECTGVYKVDLDDASCLGPTSIQCGASGFEEFGMGFSTNDSSSGDDTLFLAEGSLGRVDLGSGQVTSIGSLPTDDGELTGNAKNELWGFLPGASSVIQIDKTSGDALTTFPLDLDPDAYAWAFAFWGGSFYIFYESGSDTSTNVYKLSVDGQLTMHIADTGLAIVGAGVSTCAPVEPPTPD